MSGVLRRTISLLARPKGPLGGPAGGVWSIRMPYRTELAHIKTLNGLQYNTNYRELGKKPIMTSAQKATPRDFGEIPRKFVLQLLFLHQPIRLVDLWDLCKQRDDVPLDSAKHLRGVLKIAKLQKWVYCEKNQSNNLWYYYIHQARHNEVQDMIRNEATLKKEEEAKEVAERDFREDAEKERKRQQMDDAIVALQNALISNVSRIHEFDPSFTRGLPYVTESGAVNVAWHHSKTPQKEEAEN